MQVKLISASWQHKTQSQTIVIRNDGWNKEGVSVDRIKSEILEAFDLLDITFGSGTSDFVLVEAFDLFAAIQGQEELVRVVEDNTLRIIERASNLHMVEKGCRYKPEVMMTQGSSLLDLKFSSTNLRESGASKPFQDQCYLSKPGKGAVTARETADTNSDDQMSGQDEPSETPNFSQRSSS